MSEPKAQENKKDKAEEYIASHAQDVKPRWYPRFHIAPRCGWCNDPNGMSYFQGAYHVFYQYYPYEPKWGPMHWAHASSKDLVRWQREPVALAPDKSYDADGCFSGCGIEKDGSLYLLYTGHVDLPKKSGQPDRIETQNLAVSRDGRSFEKFSQNPVMELPETVSTGEDRHFRDPKVWRHGDRYYAVVGAQTEENVGQVLLFESQDLKDWTFRQVMAKAEGNQGFMWECPNFAEFDGHEALILSPQGVKPEGHRYLNLHQSVVMSGRMDYDSGVFAHGDFELLDYGFDFYAPQVVQTPDGRCLMLGWLAMWESAMPEQADGWAGMMTIPRELHYRNGHVVSVPARELADLRRTKHEQPDMTLREETSIADWARETGELCVDFDLADAEGLTVHFVGGSDEKISVRIEKESGTVCLSCKSAAMGSEENRWAKLSPSQEKFSLRVYQDRSSLEIFLNDGEAVMSTRFYPRDGQRALVIEPQEGAVTMTNGVFYELDDIF